MKKLPLFIAFIMLIFLSKTSVGQIIDTPIERDLTPKVYKMFLIRGRVVGVNLEDVTGANITNKRTAEKVVTNSRGIYELNAATDDTLFFEISKYSKAAKIVKNPKQQLNVVLIRRKADELPADHPESDYRKAVRADEELLRILEKDAKLEGKWNY